MLCQICLRAEATIHVSDPTAGEPPVESDYCHACFHIKYAQPTDPPEFPLKRFTIKGLMIVTGLFAILNAIVVLYMRSGLVTGTPAQTRDWTLKVLLIHNCCFAAFLGDSLVKSWLKKSARYRMTGGATHTLLRKSNRHPTDHIDVWSSASPRERVFLALLQVWFLVCISGFLFPSSDSHSWIIRLNLRSLLALLLLMITIWALLLWGLVASMRRR
jgi:hypothetical protein